jgi:hypothetical protein
LIAPGNKEIDTSQRLTPRKHDERLRWKPKSRNKDKTKTKIIIGFKTRRGAWKPKKERQDWKIVKLY